MPVENEDRPLKTMEVNGLVYKRRSAEQKKKGIKDVFSSKVLL